MHTKQKPEHYSLIFPAELTGPVGTGLCRHSKSELRSAVVLQALGIRKSLALH